MKFLSASLKKIVKTLGHGEFHSGASLGKILNLSRNAVWKQINQLNKYGVEVESAQSKGYRLKNPLILLDKNLIKKNLSVFETFTPNKIEILGSIASTNDYLKQQRITQLNEIYICMAEHQSAGHGRFGRSWYSPFGANIYLSCRWCIPKDASMMNGLSLVIALAVIKTLEQCALSQPLSLKWPNDILYQDKKLAGILIQINSESHGLTQVLIGIGININMPVNVKNKINQDWISLNHILNQYQDRNKIASILINQLIHHLEQFNQSGLAAFLPQLQSYDYLRGKKINLTIEKNIVSGIASGINEQGHLLLMNRSGIVSAYSAGETTLKV